MDLSTVIVNYKSRIPLLDCVASLQVDASVIIGKDYLEGAAR